MTLLETERLVRKMTELLQQGGNSDLGPKLAGDYAAACHAANLRLQQCEGMVKASDRHQAIQLAETAPNLLDVVTVLEFRGTDDWRAFCQQNSLPVAERIDARSVHELNECYALGITTDHPLYAAYRKAVLNRNDEEALKTLQSITRLNPTDGNAASELVRLDAKVLSARISNLGGLLTGGDMGSVVAAIEAIEAFGFKCRPEGDIWCKAEAIRCGCWLNEAAELKKKGHWQEVLAKLHFLQSLQKELKLDLPNAALKHIEELGSWAGGEQEKDRKEREFQALLTELQYRIQESEEKDTSARYVKLPELREDSEALHKVWRSLSDYTRPIPEDATASFRKRSSLLDAEIARRTAIRLRLILAGSAAAVVIGAVVAWLVLDQMKAGEFVKQLQAAVAQHQTRAAEQLIARLNTSEKHLLSVGSVNTVFANAQAFVAEEHALLANFDAAFSKLPTKLEGDPNAAQINAVADQLTQTRAALNALSPDLKAEHEPRVQAFEQQWQQYLSEGGTVVNGILEQWIGSAEKQCDQLDYQTPVKTAAAQIATLSGVIQKIHDCETGFTNHVNLRNDLLLRAGALRGKFSAYERELNKIDTGVEAIKKAATFNDYSSAISGIASSEFSGAPAVADAISLKSIGINEETALRSLLNATNPATWAFINKNKAPGFIPEIAMPVERQTFQRLYADPAVNDSHHHYRLWLNAENTSSEEWITAGSIDKSFGWKKIKVWMPAASATSATFQDRDYGNFDGSMKLSATQFVSRLEEIPSPDDLTAFTALGLRKVYWEGSNYGGSLLDVLDAIKDSQDLSPVFRAYLFCNLERIMEFQPDAWGLTFCPAIRTDAQKIQDVAGGQIASGDWFIASKNDNWNVKLNQLFDAEKTVSYAQLAGANLALARTAAKDGFRYVGFVGLDGKPVISETPAPSEIWAYDAIQKQPVHYKDSAMPLSPLFALPLSRAEYLTQAGINTASSSIANALPPLFQPFN
jgi:hypothetical protein